MMVDRGRLVVVGGSQQGGGLLDTMEVFNGQREPHHHHGSQTSIQRSSAQVDPSRAEVADREARILSR